MAFSNETSDAAILDLLRRTGTLGILELVANTHVTATAVRQRLCRLMKLGLVCRETANMGRGRPQHRYMLTEKGRRRIGGNFEDLAMVLWKEIRSVPDSAVRRGLYGRIAKNMAGLYKDQITGSTVSERAQSIAKVFAERDVPFIVEQPTGETPGQTGGLPVLTALACPYPQLAEQDRGVCAMERMMLEELLSSGVRLNECRLDGDSCCRFTPAGVSASRPAAPLEVVQVNVQTAALPIH